jgi:hypothetical protein
MRRKDLGAKTLGHLLGGGKNSQWLHQASLYPKGRGGEKEISLGPRADGFSKSPLKESSSFLAGFLPGLPLNWFHAWKGMLWLSADHGREKGWKRPRV